MNINTPQNKSRFSIHLLQANEQIFLALRGTAPKVGGAVGWVGGSKKLAII